MAETSESSDLRVTSSSKTSKHNNASRPGAGIDSSIRMPVIGSFITLSLISLSDDLGSSVLVAASYYGGENSTSSNRSSGRRILKALVLVYRVNSGRLIA